MVRRWFYLISAVTLLIVGGLAVGWSPHALWALVVIAPLIAVGIHDSVQSQHTILRNFPLIGHGRYILESLRPELHQYFIESNIDAFPIEREYRSVVYQRAKGKLETKPFGTQRNVYEIGYEWCAHSMNPRDPLHEAPRIVIGQERRQPYSASLLNISAMSYGALSKNAILALNSGAKQGEFAHNTGEGGIAPYHLEYGGDLIWQLGTAYFGCRAQDGGFDPGAFAEQAAHESVRMIEIKLSQGAKPGHGGVLPAEKVTPEIAAIRRVPVGQTVLSPPGHKEFSTPNGLLEFVQRLRDLSGDKPVGFKLCVGQRAHVLSICKAMLETDIVPDFITVDGGEGGTGAAPLEFSNSVGMPARDAWILVHSALRGTGLRDRVRLVASGKIFTGFHMVRALALGADVCVSARGMMLALGCIQALRCNSGHCPTGVTTHNPRLVHGLDVADKAVRVTRYHKGMLFGFLELLAAMGLEHPDDLRPHHVFRRIDDFQVHRFSELYDFLEPGELLNGGDAPPGWQEDWNAARGDRWD